MEFHKSHGKLATLTAVKITQDEGVLDITKDQAVRAFREKNTSDGSLSAWDIENSINEQAAVASSEDYKDVVAVSEYVLPYIHGVYKDKWIRHAVENLSRLSLYINSGRGVVPLPQQIKIDMTNWLQWKISPKQRRLLKNVLSRMGMKFSTKR